MSYLTRFVEFIDNMIDFLGNTLCEWLGYLDETDIGMNVAVRIFMAAISIIILWLLFKRMLKSQIKESAFLMWCLPAALLFIYGVWPELTYYVADLTHMAYGYALVVTVPFIALLYYIAFRYMCQISELTSKVTELGSVVSLQKHEIESLKKQINELQQGAESKSEPESSAENKASEKSSVDVIIR